MSKSYQTYCVCTHFNIKTSKTKCFFTKNLQFSCPGALAEIIGKPYESYEFCQIQRFHVTARCTRDALSCTQGANPVPKIPRGRHARASPRAHVQILPESSPSSAPSLALPSLSPSSPVTALPGPPWGVLSDPRASSGHLRLPAVSWGILDSY